MQQMTEFLMAQKITALVNRYEITDRRLALCMAVALDALQSR